MIYVRHVVKRLENCFVFFNQQYENQSKVTGFFNKVHGHMVCFFFFFPSLFSKLRKMRKKLLMLSAEYEKLKQINMRTVR